jgi:hypothetical protein
MQELEATSYTAGEQGVAGTATPELLQLLNSCTGTDN